MDLLLTGLKIKGIYQLSMNNRFKIQGSRLKIEGYEYRLKLNIHRKEFQIDT
jgi:hypothetical protein